MTLKELLEQNKEVNLISCPNGNRGLGKTLYRNISNLKRYMNYKVECVSGTRCWISK